MHELAADRSIPDFVSRDDLLCQVEIINNILQLITLDTPHNKHIRILHRFAQFIHNEVLIEGSAQFANHPIRKYLVDSDWCALAGLLVSDIPKIRLVAHDFRPLIQELCNKLQEAVAYASSQQWKEYVNKCLSKGGGKMFSFISKKIKPTLA